LISGLFPSASIPAEQKAESIVHKGNKRGGRVAHGQKTKKTVKMGKTAPAHPKPMPFGRLLLISFAVFNLGYIVDETIRWSDHLQGLANGL
jgi:hypothetical protein